MRKYFCLLLIALWSPSLQADEQALAVLSSMLLKYQSLTSYSCEYEEYDPRRQADAFSSTKRRGLVQGSGLMKRRYDEHYASGHIGYRLFDGKDEYLYQSYNSEVTKRKSAGFASSVPSPLYQSVIRKGRLVDVADLQKITRKKFFKGVEDIEGKPSDIVQSGQYFFWIDRSTGLVSRKETFSYADVAGLEKLNMEGVRLAGKVPFGRENFLNCEVNPPLEVRRFVFTPQPGTKVVETWWKNGEKKEKATTIPFPEYAFGKAESEQAAQKIKEVRTRFEALKDFRLSYHHRHAMGHQVTQQNGTTVAAVEVSKGTLKGAPEGKLHYEYGSANNSVQLFDKTTGNTAQQQRKGLYVTDGDTVWKSGDLVSGPGVVTKHRKGLMKNMMQAIGMPPGGGQASQAPAYVERFYEAPPLFLFELYSLLRSDALKFEGEETLAGEAVYRFTLALTPDNLRTEYWIGKADGIPRKIIEYVWRTDSVKVRYDLTEVSVNTGLEQKDFVYNPEVSGGKAGRVMDMDAQAPAMQQMMRNTFNTPPETTFFVYFRTSPEDVKNLQGSGFAWFSHDFFVRFEAEKQPEFKEELEIKLVDRDEKEPAEFFLKHFPADKSSLEDRESLHAQESHAGKKHFWLLQNRKTKTWFFRAWSDE